MTSRAAEAAPSAPVDDIAFHARLTPVRLAALEFATGRTWSYAALDQAVSRCVTVLRERDVGVGDRVAALARNRVVLVILHHACARMGAIYVPLNWRLARAEIEALIADAEPVLTIGEDGVLGWPVAALEAAIDAADPAPPAPIDRERASLILYTSGTTGRPKGVMLSERAIDTTASTMALLGHVTHDSHFLCDSPMFHVIGIVTNIRPALRHGGAILVSDGFEAGRAVARLGDPALGVTHYFCVPQMARMLRAVSGFDPAALAGLTAIFTGGAPHPAADIRAWADDGIAIVNGFGMSEAGTVSHTAIDLGAIVAKPGACGVPGPRSAMRVVDAAGDVLPPDGIGELQIAGPNLFSGYWRRPAETAAAFTADGWFRTGDIARIDADDWLWIVDRAKDMFISGGENVYPAEIENVLAGHSAIAECAVVGVPDERWGEVGHLALVPRGAGVDRAAVRDLIAASLARYKVPKHVSIVDALPRNGAGKVVKAELRRLLGH